MIDDPEILELLREDPELLAIADAIQQTQQPLPARRRPFRRASAGLGLAACLAIVAAAGAFVLRPGATAGIPSGKYVHVVLQREDPSSWLVSLRDGSRVDGEYTDNVWIRDDGGVALVEHSHNGQLLETAEDTASAGSSSRGPARLSPDLRTGEGVEPLVAIYDGVPAALQRHGGVVVKGPSTIYGHRVRWIGFGRTGGRARAVAVDADTDTPIALRDSGNGPAARIVSMGLSGKPTLSKPHGKPVGGSGHAVATVSVSQAAAALPGALWAGESLAGLQLRRVIHERLTQSNLAGVRPGLTLRYGQDLAHPLMLSRFVYISEARQPEAAYQFPGIGGIGPLPRRGFLQVSSPGAEARTRVLTALVHLDRMYVRIWTNLPDHELAAVVRDLRPLG